MKILSFDSSATAASVALIEDDKVIGEFYINTKITHSQTLLPMTESLLSCVQMKINEVDVFAVNAGPGSFTGVRIGVAAVKGMSIALNKPCISVSTLDSMAYNLKSQNCIAVCVMDARCEQVYNANFDIKNGVIKRLCDDRALKIDDLKQELESLSKEIVFVGDGADLCYNKLKDKLPYTKLAEESKRYQNAVSTALIAKELYNEGKILSAEDLMPLYLRLPQAERELKRRKESK